MQLTPTSTEAVIYTISNKNVTTDPIPEMAIRFSAIDSAPSLPSSLTDHNMIDPSLSALTKSSRNADRSHRASLWAVAEISDKNLSYVAECNPIHGYL